MARLIVTGARGQLGSEISKWGRNAGFAVDAFDRPALDITDVRAVQERFDLLRPDVIVNAAAYTAVDRAETERDAAMAVNRDGAACLAAASAHHGIPIVHLSTDYVFDGAKQAAYLECDTTGPINHYGASKLAGEAAVRSLNPRHVILRTSWVYGQNGGNFVKTMLRLAASQDRVRVVADQRGCPTSARDLAIAVLKVAKTAVVQPADPRRFGVFHCAGSSEATWYELACETFELATPFLARRPLVEPISTAEYPTPALRPRNSTLDCSRLYATYGIRLRPWRLALREMVMEFRAGFAKSA